MAIKTRSKINDPGFIASVKEFHAKQSAQRAKEIEEQVSKILFRPTKKLVIIEDFSAAQIEILNLRDKKNYH